MMFDSHTVPIAYNNPLQPETFFSSHFEIKPTIGSYSLPTHKRDANIFFFSMVPSFFKNEILTIWEEMVPLGSNGLKYNYISQPLDLKLPDLPTNASLVDQ